MIKKMHIVEMESFGFLLSDFYLLMRDEKIHAQFPMFVWNVDEEKLSNRVIINLKGTQGNVYGTFAGEYSSRTTLLMVDTFKLEGQDGHYFFTQPFLSLLGMSKGTIEIVMVYENGDVSTVRYEDGIKKKEVRLE